MTYLIAFAAMIACPAVYWLWRLTAIPQDDSVATPLIKRSSRPAPGPGCGRYYPDEERPNFISLPDPDLSSWDVSSVTDTKAMFRGVPFNWPSW